MPVRSAEFARALVIAGIVGGDLHAHVPKCDADRLADSARAAGDDRNSCHDALPCWSRSAPIPAPPAFKLTADQKFQHGDAFGRIVEAIEQRELLAARLLERLGGRECRALRESRCSRPKSPARRRRCASRPSPGSWRASRRLPAPAISRGRTSTGTRLDVAPKRFAEQPRRLLAMAMIGIAELKRPHRHSVEAQQQPFRLRNRAHRAGARGWPASASI